MESVNVWVCSMYVVKLQAKSWKYCYVTTNVHSRKLAWQKISVKQMLVLCLWLIYKKVLPGFSTVVSYCCHNCVEQKHQFKVLLLLRDKQNEMSFLHSIFENRNEQWISNPKMHKKILIIALLNNLLYWISSLM